MDSSPNSFRNLFLASIATLLSAAGFYFATGLYPVWVLMWLAALPLLLIAPKLSWQMAFLTALLARALGGLSQWGYHQMLHLPLWLCLIALLGPALVFAQGIVWFRSFFQRGQLWRATLALPCLFIAYEYLHGFPFGTFEDTAYSQMNNLPVLQLGSLTGLWGIGFAVLLFAPALAVLLLSSGSKRRSIAIAFAAFYGCVFAYGTWHLHATPPAADSVRVGLAASDLPENLYQLGPGEEQRKMQLLRDYADQVRLLAAQGAKVVVLPEMTIFVSDSLSPQVDQLFEETARAAKAQVLLGVLHGTSAGTFNEARLYSDAGDLQTVYRKHHLVPGFEGNTAPGTDISVLPRSSGKIGVAICRDMDYPELSRRYGKENVGLLLVPAWDFDVDRWSHGRMALMRAVEDGFSIVRSVKLGILTVSDDRGRVLAERATTPSVSFTTLLATVPLRHNATLYQKWGDWFAWINLATLLALAFVGRTKA